MAEKTMNLALQSIFFHTSMGLSHVKCYDMGPTASLSLRKKDVLCIFIALKNPSSSVGFEPANFGSNGKHDNHHTTEDNYVHNA
jgi:hypothetical protein